MASFNPLEKMSPADKLLRLATAGGFALLLLLATVRSFGEGPDPQQPATQTAEASSESSEEDSAEPEATEDETTDTAETETATDDTAPEPEAEVAETDTETSEAEAAETETAETETTESESAESESAEAETTESDATETEVAETDAAELAPDDASEAEMQEFAILANADAERGEGLFRQCSACHQYATERNAGGPHLVGIVGRDIGAVDSWRYSDALMEAEGAWTPERLEQWLENPDDYLPGNRMAYPGVRAEQDRLDLIAFLAAQGQE